MAAELTRAYDDVTDDVFDTGDPRSFLHHLELAEVVAPVRVMLRLCSVLFDRARRRALSPHAD